MLSNPGPPSTVVLYFPNCEWSTWEERGSYIFSKKKIIEFVHDTPEGSQATPISTQEGMLKAMLATFPFKHLHQT